MKRILFAVIFPLEGSGSGQYTLDLGYWLAKRGHDVEILSVSNPNTTIYKEINSGKKSKYKILKIKEIPFPNSLLDEFPGFTGHPLQTKKYIFKDMTKEDSTRYLTLLRDNLKDAIHGFSPDFIIANHVTPLSGLISEIQKESGTKIPVVQVSHGAEVKVKGDLVSGTNQKSTFKDPEVYDEIFVKYFQIGRYSVVKTISTSDDSHKRLTRIGFEEKDIRKRFKGYDPESFNVSVSVDKAKMMKDTIDGLKQDRNKNLFDTINTRYKEVFDSDYLESLPQILEKKYIFVSTGKFTLNSKDEIYKGADRVIDAAKILAKTRDDFAVIIFGDGPAAKDLIYDACSKESGNIFFGGFQDNTEIIPAWNKVAISGLYPSRNDAFNLSSIECAACGTVPITSNDGGFPSYIEKIGGTMVSSFPDELVDAMNKSIDENWNEKRKEKFEQVKEFSWEKIAQEIDEEVISKL